MSALLWNISHLTDLDLSHNRPGDSGMDLLCTVLQTHGCRINKLKYVITLNFIVKNFFTLVTKNNPQSFTIKT